MIEQLLAHVSPLGRVAFILFLLESQLGCLREEQSREHEQAINELDRLIDVFRRRIVHSDVNFIADLNTRNWHVASASNAVKCWKNSLASTGSDDALPETVTSTLVGLALAVAGHPAAGSTIQDAIVKFTADLNETDRAGVLHSNNQAAKVVLNYATRDTMLPRGLFEGVPMWPITGRARGTRKLPADHKVDLRG